MAFAQLLSSADAPASSPFPTPEKLTYEVDWRLIDAGTATVQLARGADAHAWSFDIKIESAGLVSRLYRVLDSYKVSTSDRFCAANASLDAQEGKKHTITKLAFDYSRKKVNYDEHDLIRNTTTQKEVDIVACTHEIAGAFATLRTLDLQPGKSTTVPISDGKKFAQAKVEAQAREKITVAGKPYDTIRYEAYLFDGVLYRRHGRLLIWVSEDPGHLPVQFRLLIGFPIGTITVSLQKQQR